MNLDLNGASVETAIRQTLYRANCGEMDQLVEASPEKILISFTRLAR